MDQERFEMISKLFAQRRLSRRRAMQHGAAGLAAAGLTVAGLKAAAAQDGTPAAVASPAAGGEGTKTEFLFVQSFEGGSIAPKDGAEGAYTLTLQHGLGQTIYFSDRPERIVGAAPTPRFLEGLGFSPDNPPNAALVVETADGGVDIAVVELTNPSYDESSFTATYDATVLQNYDREAGLQFQEATTDLAAVAASFGSAHLFIDDCPDTAVNCYVGIRELGTAGVSGTCWSWDDWQCHLCDQAALNDRCNELYPDCEKQCVASVWTT